MKKKIGVLLAAALVFSFAAGQANASLVINAHSYAWSDTPLYSSDPSYGTTWWAGTGTANLNADAIKAIVGYTGVFSELYKKDANTSPATGLYQTSYTTTFSNDNESAEIKWAGAPQPAITWGPIYLFVKDGNHIPSWYLFNLTSLHWDGKETINLINFWTEKGEISHLGLYGPPVPVPPTAWLLVSGLLGLVALRRFKR
ncbi:MAG: hypothetical protein HPY67_09210 [Syntrophaceae bacterium]|nr:hypothetical protein [Syntrophaceae bacterium]